LEYVVSRLLLLPLFCPNARSIVIQPGEDGGVDLSLGEEQNGINELLEAGLEADLK
jgi:hypothetical protein